MTKERLWMSVQTVKENIAIIEEEGAEDAGYFLQLEHEKHILELLEAEAEGRIVVLPCKVGDTVYSKDGKAAIVEEYIIDRRNMFAAMGFECNYNCCDCAFNSWHTEYSGESSCYGEYGTATVSCEDFCKTIFLTMEEAEAALKVVTSSEEP